MNDMELLMNQVIIFSIALWPSADFNKHTPFWGLGDAQHHDAELVLNNSILFILYQLNGAIAALHYLSCDLSELLYHFQIKIPCNCK